MDESTTSGTDRTTIRLSDLDAIGITESTGTESGTGTGSGETANGGIVKRRRGRPRKDTGANTNTGEKPETITVEETPTVTRRTRTSRKQQTEEDAKATALVLVAMLNTAASNIAGPEATMNSFETALIQPSLVRSLQRGGASAEKINTLIDPLALVIGMSMWGSRVLGVRQQKTALAKQGYGEMPASEPVLLNTEQYTASNGLTPDELLRGIER